MVRDVIERILRAADFFVAADYRWRLEYIPQQTIRWEILLGQLLSPEKTRQTQTFASWQVWLESLDSANPSTPNIPWLAVHWESEKRTVFVVRSLLVNGWEAVELSPGVITSRPAMKWLTELMATISIDPWSEDEFSRDLLEALKRSSVGLSRLPITSPETPHPFYSLGKCCSGLGIGALSALSAVPCSDPWELWEHEMRRARNGEPIRPWIFEFLVRAVRRDDCAPLARRFLSHCQETGDSPTKLFQQMFQQMSLTPYTDFVDKLMDLVRLLADSNALGRMPMIDLLGYMLRHLVRHLNAYDLRRFHSFGANYPDALFLDALLQQLLAWASEDSLPFLGPAQARIRRRAIRMGWLMRMSYEGLAVPDQPTSQGENVRVFPGHAAVPEVQIANPDSRTRRLFADQPTDGHFQGPNAELLRQSILDLNDSCEQLELGTATFVDRPFGIFKQPGAADRTPLLANIAFSQQIIDTNWMRIATARGDKELDSIQRLRFAEHGIACDQYPIPVRPGVVSWGDAAMASPDFRWLTTTTSSRRLLRERLGLSDTDPESNGGLWLRTAANLQQVLAGEPLFRWFDSRGQIGSEWIIDGDDKPAPVTKWYRELPDGEDLMLRLQRLDRQRTSQNG